MRGSVPTVKCKSILIGRACSDSRDAWRSKMRFDPVASDHFASVMERNNFQRMKSDLNLYVHKAKRLYVLAYVDDLMFFGCKPDVDDLISILRKELILKVTGPARKGNIHLKLSHLSHFGASSRYHPVVWDTWRRLLEDQTVNYTFQTPEIGHLECRYHG